VGERLTRVAADKTRGSDDPEQTEEPEQTLYF